jgi:flavin-dependent dehydrogenase
VTSPSAADIVVAGGGPAGATIAHQLAGFGYRVVLIEKRRFPRHQIGESLTPSILPLLDFLGVRTQVEQAGFLRMAGHSVCWGSSRPRTAHYSSDQHWRGFQSVRADFDLILLNHARQAGVQVMEGQPVRDVRPDGEHDVTVRYGSGERIRTAFCVDATGHAGIYARQNLRQRDRVFQTMALTGYWQNAGNPPGVDFANTLLEAYADGMVWSVPLHTGERNVTLLIDWRHSRAIKRVGLQRFYIEELRKAAYVSGFLTDAHLPHPPQVFDASLYTARQFVAGRTLLVGDAGLFIDPLSSEGVRKAMASAITGAVVVNTILQRPAMQSQAAELYEAGQRDTYHSHYQQSARYYAEEGRWPDRPFWQHRCLRLEPDAVPAAPQQPAVTFSPFDSQPVSHLMVTPDLRIQEKPVIEGSYVELRPAVVTPRYPRGLRFLSGVNVPTLLRYVQTQCAVPDILEAYQRHPDGRQSPPAQIRQVLAQLYQEGLLRPISPDESQSD